MHTNTNNYLHACVRTHIHAHTYVLHINLHFDGRIIIDKQIYAHMYIKTHVHPQMFLYMGPMPCTLSGAYVDPILLPCTLSGAYGTASVLPSALSGAYGVLHLMPCAAHRSSSLARVLVRVKIRHWRVS